MQFGIFELLKLFGSLGVFLYGMKLMSESLQKVAGDKMRDILTAMTSNRFFGILTGVLITAVIQSSSATTVMVVSFVNAGLLSLMQSVGVIMGANIGTTVTAWLISLLGFKVKISLFALPLVGLSFPLMFSKNNNRKSWGELIIGFALVFMGLDFLKGSVPDIKGNIAVLEFLSTYSSAGIWSTILFVIIGSILTMVIQSSSATMALTLVMCNNGWISFDIAAAMVLGENIGTTITANLASMVGNVSARRAARIHLLFNVFGVIWILTVFPYFLKGIESFMIYSGGNSPFNNTGSIPIGLSIFHTSFNVLNVLLLIGFAPLFVKISEKLVKDTGEEEEFRLQHIGIGTVSMSEIGIIQAKKEIEDYGKRTTKMFEHVKSIFDCNKNKKFDKLFEKIEKYENASDETEVEIAHYIGKLAESELSELGSKRIHAMLSIINEIESISDCNYNITKTINRKKHKKVELTSHMIENIKQMFVLLDEALEIMNKNLVDGYKNANYDKAFQIETEINNYRNKLRKSHLKHVETKKYNYLTGIIYSDLFSECEKLGDYIINVTENIIEIRSNL